MTLAPSPRLRLSGNKFLFALVFVLMLQRTAAQPTVSHQQDQPAELVIALLLPFRSNDVYETESGKIHFSDESLLSVEYFQGASLATDSLRKAGINCKLFVFDSGEDSVQLNAALKKIETLPCNVIIAPVNNSAVLQVDKFAKTHNIFCFSPYSTMAFPSSANDHFFIANASMKTHLERTLEFIRQQFSLKNIFVVYQGSDNKMVSFIREYLREKFPQEKTANVIALSDTGKVSYRNFAVWRNKDSENEVLILSSNEPFVRTICHSIRQADSAANIFGMPTWQNFSEPENDFDHQNVFISSPYFINDSLKTYQKFEDAYQRKFSQIPSIHSANGFDQVFYIAEGWRNEILNGSSAPVNQQTAHRFNFQPVKDETGTILYYENEATFILKFDHGFFSLYE